MYRAVRPLSRILFGRFVEWGGGKKCQGAFMVLFFPFSSDHGLRPCFFPDPCYSVITF